ncbi:hypothetical protein V6Z12_D01G100800 [Gossypium hirsutum]
MRKVDKEDTRWAARMALHSSTEKGNEDEDKVEGGDEDKDDNGDENKDTDNNGDEDEHEGKGEEEKGEDDGHDLVKESTPVVVRKNPTPTHQPQPCDTHST